MPSGRSPLRRVVIAVVYPLYLIAILLGVHYFMNWRPYITKIRARAAAFPDRPIPSQVRPLIGNLGSFLNDKASTFTQFSTQKDAGRTRVCAFGDSYTFGEEVDQSHDYPTLLQELFERRGHTDVEVLNFGSGWHGFHQTFFLWDRLGRSYACDYLLLGPGNFFRDRDVTFNHTGMKTPTYMHAIYVLDGDDDVRLVSVLGNTRDERVEEYARFFPRWQYWRYDSNPPPSLLSALPPERTTINPFYYYSGSPKDEALATYRILLRKMAESGSKVILLHGDRSLLTAAANLNLPNLRVANEFPGNGFPYFAPKGHRSAWGNRLVADQFYAHITGEMSRPMSVLRTSNERLPQVEEGARLDKPLFRYDRLELMLAGKPVGNFVDAGAQLEGDTRRVQVDKRTVSMLALTNPWTPLFTSCFVSLNQDLQPDAQVSLMFEGNRQPINLGHVRMLVPGNKLGTVDLGGLQCGCNRGMRCSFGKQFRDKWQLPNGTLVSLALDGTPLARGSVANNNINFKTEKGRVKRILAGLYGYRDVEDLPATGFFDLVIRRSSEPAVRIPVGRWSKFTKPIPRPRRAGKSDDDDN